MRDESKDSVDNLLINNDMLENFGDDDEAVKDEEITRINEDQGHDIGRTGHHDGVLFDTIDTDKKSIMVG